MSAPNSSAAELAQNGFFKISRPINTKSARSFLKISSACLPVLINPTAPVATFTSLRIFSAAGT